MSSPTPPIKKTERAVERSPDADRIRAHGADSSRHALGLSKARHCAASARAENAGRPKNVDSKDDQATAATAGGTPITPSAEPLPNSGDLPNLLAGAISAAGEQEQVVDTELYHVVFSNRGATVKSWTLKKFKDSAEMPLELVNRKGAEKVGCPFASPSATSSRARTSTRRCGSRIPRRRPHHQLRILRRPHSRHEDLRAGARRLHGAVLRRGHAERRAASRIWSNGAAVSATWLCRPRPDNKPPFTTTRRRTSSSAAAAKIGKNGPSNADGVFSFAGIDDQYFAAAFLPPPNTRLANHHVRRHRRLARQHHRRTLSRRCGRRRRAQSVRDLHRSKDALRCCTRSIRSSMALWTGAGSASSPSRCSWSCTS